MIVHSIHTFKIEDKCGAVKQNREQVKFFGKISFWYHLEECIFSFNPRPPEIFFVTRPRGRIFYTERLKPLYLLLVYMYGLLLPIDTKMSTIEIHITLLCHVIKSARL